MAYELRALAAPADGQAAAALLCVSAAAAGAGGGAGSRRGGEYLFGAPEGLARFALEHRMRPGLRLRAVFAPSAAPDAAGGLAGLLLRLKADGHGAIALCGPPGVAESLEALRHLFSWRHPEVAHRRLPPSPEPAFADEWVEVRARGCREPPPPFQPLARAGAPPQLGECAQ